MGVENVVTGAGLASGGTAVACGATLCLAAGATIAGGVAVDAVGTTQVVQGSTGLGENLALLSGKSKGTDHFQNRRSDPGRPTSVAWQDAQRAGPGSVFRDSETGYYVVKGKKGRIHIFIENNGQLQSNTSYINQAENTQERIVGGKWVNLMAEEYQLWLEMLNP